MAITRQDIIDRLHELGYQFFSSGDYNLNIVGIRYSNTNTNRFTDEIHVIYKVNGRWVHDVYQATTKPGTASLLNPTNSKGTAILVPGQYRSSFKLGYHKGKYLALVQTKPLKVYRDGDRDKVLDLNPKTIDEGIYGINIHKSGRDSVIVDNWSAGCQVFKRSSDFNRFITICNKSKDLYGNSFTYTLLDKWK
jgi:hypothetical protein